MQTLGRTVALEISAHAWKPRELPQGVLVPTHRFWTGQEELLQPQLRPLSASSTARQAPPARNQAHAVPNSHATPRSVEADSPRRSQRERNERSQQGATVTATAADVAAAGRSLTLGLLHSLNMRPLSFAEMHAYAGMWKHAGEGKRLCAKLTLKLFQYFGSSYRLVCCILQCTLFILCVMQQGYYALLSHVDNTTMYASVFVFFSHLGTYKRVACILAQV